MHKADCDNSIIFNNLRIDSINESSGIFAGKNLQCLWCSDRTACAGFGIVRGEENTLDNPCSIVTDPGSSSELTKHYEELVRTRIGKRGI